MKCLIKLKENSFFLWIDITMYTNNLESRTHTTIKNVFHPEHNQQQSWMSFTQNTTNNNLECLSPRKQTTTKYGSISTFVGRHQKICRDFNLPLTKISFNARPLCKVKLLFRFSTWCSLTSRNPVSSDFILSYNFHIQSICINQPIFSYCCDPLPFNQTKHFTKKSFMISKE